jgi:hypothetical protein
LRIILMVNPEPMVVTVEPRHVVMANLYSKSVLRVATEIIRKRHERVDYFGAYELVMTAAGAFGDDRRVLRPAAFERVMRSFFDAFVPTRPTLPPLPVLPFSISDIAAMDARASDADDACGEAYLANFLRAQHE